MNSLLKNLRVPILLLTLVGSGSAYGVTLTSGTQGIVVDGGDTGQFVLSGPVLSFPKAGDEKNGTVNAKAVFAPAADGLGGTITYPDSPSGSAKLQYKISPADNTVTYSYDEIAPAPRAFDFEMELLAGRFLGGLCVLGDKPPTQLPIGVLEKGLFSHDTSFSLATRDGTGLTIKTPEGTIALQDRRRFNGETYAWRHQHPFKAAEKSMVLSFADFTTTPPPVDVKPDGPPADGSKWEVIPELTDEFNGDKLDPVKWNNGDHRWAGREPSWFSPNNVEIKDGRLQLIAKLEEPPEELKAKKYHTFSAAYIGSKKLALYGYYETKAKIMDVRICNAFWFWNSDEKMASEIDVFEICGGKNKFERTLFHTIHVAKPADGSKPFAKGLQMITAKRFADDYHVFGLDWGKDEIKCYLDGYLFASRPNTHWHQPLTMVFDNEVNIPWFGQTEKTGFPAVFNVEYVRAWKRVEQPASTGNN